MLRTVTADLAAVVATALAAALVLVQPWAGRRRYQRLLAAVKADPQARMRHYRRGIIGEWAVVAVIAVVGVLARRTPASIGLNLHPLPDSEAALVAGLGAMLGSSALVFRFGGDKVVDALRRQARGFAALLPRGRQERLVFAGFSVTAGICEEVIFRGFGIAYLRWLWPGAPRPALIAITAIAFGLAHLYQGPRGVILTGALGACLAWTVLSNGSLVPAMAIHALLDLRILAMPDLTAGGSEPAGHGPDTAAATVIGSVTDRAPSG